MKVTLVTDTELPGGLLIEAESPAESLVLRMFTQERRNLIIASHGGNIAENRTTVFIKHASVQCTCAEGNPLFDPNCQIHGYLTRAQG